MSKSDTKKLIIELFIIFIMLIAVSWMIYDNFIKKEKFEYTFQQIKDNDDFSSKFNLDFFENEVFKSLIKAEEITLPTSEELGRGNPFLKF